MKNSGDALDLKSSGINLWMLYQKTQIVYYLSSLMFLVILNEVVERFFFFYIIIHYSKLNFKFSVFLICFVY